MMTADNVKVTMFVILGLIIGETFGLYLTKTKRNNLGKILYETNLQSRNKRDIRSDYPSVHHYARHALCRTFKGKQHLYKAMKKKICGMTLSFIASLVIDLCHHRHTMLDTWVAGLFDVDGDGQISHFERNMYKDNYS
ncbi:uncharacterized protein LOC132748573 [Ruditapes philippinarum]|uniref:uncharacterized protein LOC132748573 n=1 Tax=Ruditapes philippinarum TaxID=129788 RepID=UPI00295BBC26|nr:uncharacterized protein LOC132748573 [Ruditapes philippinarum]